MHAVRYAVALALGCTLVAFLRNVKVKAQIEKPLRKGIVE